MVLERRCRVDFIEIQDGISINAEKIDGVEETDGGCKVYVGSQTYLCKLPYSALLQMLKNKSVVDRGLDKDQEMIKTMQKVDAVLNRAQFFAG